MGQPRLTTLSASDAFALGPSELATLFPSRSAAALFGALQRPWRWDERGPELSARVRPELERYGIALPELAQFPSSDGASKLVCRFGEDRVEAVHMPRAGRVTLCISSQVGCAMGCVFCATASMGLRRQLSAGQIVTQVLAAVRALGPRSPGQVTLVFMGMGEPLHNLPNVARAIEILSEPAGMGISVRRMTVSTSGLVPGIRSLASLARRPLLAVSLNATTDALRSELMPITRRYPLDTLRAALQSFPFRPRERITLEYVLLAGVNDTDGDARRLADFGRGFPHLINLIPFNEHALAPFRAPDEARVQAFARSVSTESRALVTVRRSRARDVQGACGQLVALKTRPQPAQLGG